MQCSVCDKKMIKAGVHRNKRGLFQKYLCKYGCGRLRKKE